MLDFDSTEAARLSILERARIFVMLRYGTKHKTVKQMFNASKFKTTRHLMLNEVTLPPKNVLIDVCRSELCFDYTKVKLARMVSLKDRVIMAIYMHHKIHEI